MINRGDIYYIMPSGVHGNTAGRPAIVVGNMEICNRTGRIPVVYIVKEPTDDLPGHVTVRANGVVSVALCEQVWMIPADKLGNYGGACSAAEMAQIDIALVNTMGLGGLFGQIERQEPEKNDSPDREMLLKQAEELREELIEAKSRSEELDKENDALARDLDRLEKENEQITDRCEKLSIDVVRMTERADIYESQYKALMAQVMGCKG